MDCNQGSAVPASTGGQNDLANNQGWITLIIGTLQVLAAGGVLAGNQLARWFAAAVAGLSAIEGRDEMTISMGSAEPAPTPGRTRQEEREAKRRQHVVRFVMLAAAARVAVDRRTLAGIITIAIGLVAVKGIGSERGTPALDWYRARGRGESRSSA